MQTTFFASRKENLFALKTFQILVYAVNNCFNYQLITLVDCYLAMLVCEKNTKHT